MEICELATLDTTKLIPVDEEDALELINMSRKEFASCDRKDLNEAMLKLGLSKTVMRAVRAIWRVSQCEKANEINMRQQVNKFISSVEGTIAENTVQRAGYQQYLTQERHKTIKLRALLLAATGGERDSIKEILFQKEMEIREIRELIRRSSELKLRQEKYLSNLQEQLEKLNDYSN